MPSSKRIYGYFCLPILNRDHFIGRVDIKADRKNSALIINNIFFENEKAKDVPPVKYSKAIIEFAEFNQCPNISVKKSSDDLLTKEIMLNI